MSSHAQTATLLNPYSSCPAMGMSPHAGSQAGAGTLMVPPQIQVTQGMGTQFEGGTPQCSPLRCSPAAGPSSLAQAGTLAALVQQGPAPSCAPEMGAWV